MKHYNNIECKKIIEYFLVILYKSSMNGVLIASCFIFPITIILHLINNVIIVYKRCLHKPAYYLLINLSISDILLIFAVIIRFTTIRDQNILLDIANKVFATSSVLTTFGISLDRYIAVIYCLRYWDIVTRQRLILVLVIIWLLSIAIALISSLTSKEDRTFVSDCIVVPIYILVCLTLIVSSFWIRYLRDKHEKEIRKRNIYFGIEAEKLGILQSLKAIIIDLMKLNIITATFVICAEVFRVLLNYYFNRQNPIITIIKYICNIIYVITNPLVYILSMTELKKQYKKMFICRNADGGSVYNQENNFNMISLHEKSPELVDDVHEIEDSPV